MRKVAVLVQDGVEPFGLGAMCEVWAEPYHAEDDNPVFDFVIATPSPGRVTGPSGYDLHVENGLDAAADADLVCIAPKRSFRKPSPEVVEVVKAAHDRGAYVFAHCTGGLRHRRGRPARRRAAAPPTGGTSTSWRRPSRRRWWTRTSSTSRTARS